MHVGVCKNVFVRERKKVKRARKSFRGCCTRLLNILLVSWIAGPREAAIGTGESKCKILEILDCITIRVDDEARKHADWDVEHF